VCSFLFIVAVAGKCCGCQVYVAERNRHLLVGRCVPVVLCDVMHMVVDASCYSFLKTLPTCSAQLEGDTDQRSYVFNYYLKAVVTGYNERTGMS
jgi:hypothetical protein